MDRSQFDFSINNVLDLACLMDPNESRSGCILHEKLDDFTYLTWIIGVFSYGVRVFGFG